MMGFNVLEQTENCIDWIRKWFEHNGIKGEHYEKIMSMYNRGRFKIT